LGRWIPYLHLLLYGFAASFLGPLAAVFIGYLNTQSSAVTGADRREPEAHPADSAGGSGEAPMPAEADGMAATHFSRRSRAKSQRTSRTGNSGTAVRVVELGHSDWPVPIPNQQSCSDMGPFGIGVDDVEKTDQDRLSRISTLWTLVADAKGGPAEAVTA